MKLNDAQIEKADASLRQALKSAGENDVLRTLMLLGGEDEEDDDEEDDERVSSHEDEPEALQFTTAQDYRGALIEKQKARVARSTGKTLQALMDLSLKPLGGTISRAVVVEGSARQLAAALNLPGVRHAILDRQITLDQPARPSKSSKGSKKTS